MTLSPYVLVIAPYAAPTNSAEAIQVGRIITQLDKLVTGRLITTLPSHSSWTPQDASLQLSLQHFDCERLALPFHRITNRILSSHRLARFHVPDTSRWIIGMSGRIIRHLPRRPDILYSRSYPISSALLAEKLKQKLDVPWIMHLSDPWADSPYEPYHPTHAKHEARCFAQADLITLTTENQARHYRAKYPAHAAKILVSPNVMPEVKPPITAQGDRLRLVFAGNLYGSRSPAPLVQAIALLRKNAPHLLTKLRIDMYGNAQPAILSLLHKLPDVIVHHGQVTFQEAYAAQQSADAVISIEPEISHPLSAAFLPSKVLESLALSKPLLALTPKGSETQALCEEGYGWAVAPSDVPSLAAKLTMLIETLDSLRHTTPKAPPARYAAREVAQQLVEHMRRLMVKHP